MKKKDISKDPAMIELERMIEAGELDPDRVADNVDKQPEEKSKKLYKKLSPRDLATFPQELADILGKKKSAIRLVKFKSAGIGPTELCGGVPEEYKLNNAENTGNNTEGKTQGDNKVKRTKNL